MEEGKSYQEATNFMGRFIKHHKSHLPYLQRPSSLGALTILDVWKCENAEQHRQMVKDWATCAWKAWGEHHATIARLVEDVRNKQIDKM